MKTLLLMACLLAFASCSNGAAAPAGSCDSTQSVEVYTLDDDIGEMLLVGFRGQSVDSTHHIWRDLSTYKVGSVILFDYDAPTSKRGRNIKDAAQLKELCGALRRANPEVLIGVDQEGGYVSRLAPRHGFSAVPSAKRLAAMGDDSLRRYASLTASMLAGVGINLNFAPVADVDINPQCPVIGGIERSFSADAAAVQHCCRLWVEEQTAVGVIGCLKHFPGHGSATGDTHKGLVDVSGTWQRRELEPYRDIPEGTMVMTAHVVNRQLDPSGLPASLSPRITSLLRDTLHFQGVIVTDDLAMGAVAGRYSLEQTVRLAIEAGADLLCLSNNGGTYDAELVPKVVRVIKRMVADGTVSERRIHESAVRMRQLKATASRGR